MPRWLYLGIGFFFTGLGFLGAFLPLLPATPFFLVALWAFSGSSRRFHDWLYHHRLFGPPLRSFREHRVVPRYAKALSLGTMAVTFALAWLRGSTPAWGLVAMGVLFLGSAAFVLSFPSVPPGALGAPRPAERSSSGPHPGSKVRAPPREPPAGGPA